MGSFANPVLNFTWQTDLKELPGIDGSIVEVDAALPAVDAARLARNREVSVLAVREAGGAHRGFFLPDYLVEVLPDHHLPKSRGVSLGDTADLATMIAAIDDAGLEFHSEMVNLAPNVRRCPRGHLVLTAYCSTHAVPTEEWP